MLKRRNTKRYHVVLIKPSKYDDDGYVITWWRGILTSNSLACMNGLTEDLKAKKALGADVEIVIHVYDETVQVIPVERLTRYFLKKGERATVCLVGVQTNQFARAVDIAREFRKHGFPSIIGGFHVSGCMEMLKNMPPEIKNASAEGITLVAGEVEVRWAELLKASYENRLEPFYNFVDEKPDLQETPSPVLPRGNLSHFVSAYSSIDAGRGCPFHCTFCTIINIQGNVMRGRSADDIEKIMRLSHQQNIRHIFFTDDNFARHEEWEKIADRLIVLKEKEKLGFVLQIQTDTMAHKIPHFIEKMTRAGCSRVFIGLESVNPENLRATGKYHNQLAEYRATIQAWHRHGALTYAGYIIGFPGDTYESIMKDVELLKREIPLDFAEFFIMTPLPGSVDHQNLCRDNAVLEQDTNLYDTMHVCVKHPNMSKERLMQAYHNAWRSFYSKEHMLTILKRLKNKRMRKRTVASLIWFCSSIFLEHVHPLLGGFIRLKGRRNRRPGFPREPIVAYYPRRLWELFLSIAGLIRWALELYGMGLQAARKENTDYTDASFDLTPAKSDNAADRKSVVANPAGPS